LLVGKPERKRPPTRPRNRWKNIKMNLRETDSEGLQWISLVQDWDIWQDLVNMVMKLQVQ
jgi:hypothetical protein